MMLRSSLLALSAVAFTATLSSAAFAQAPEYDRPEQPVVYHEQPGARPGLQLGARAGFGLGTGSVYQGFNVHDGSNGFVPFTADLGVRIVRELYVGAYGSYAYVIPRTNATSCPSGFDCSVKDWRVGLEADWHIIPGNALDPYIGIFGGYELLQNHVTGGTPVPTQAGPLPGAVDAKVNDKGWEVGLTGGSDIRLAHFLAIGPYFTASVGRYESRSGTTNVSVNGVPVSSTGAKEVDTAYHELFQLGLRGTLNAL
jgi:hypothetical protein